MLRRTKIVATMGPATSSQEVIEAILLAGVNVFRINMSHGTYETQAKIINIIRQSSMEHAKEIGILLDLQGPKIRISRFIEDRVSLTKGAAFALDASLDENSGTVEQVGIDYKELPRDIDKDDILLLDDGRIVLEVIDVVEQRINCTVVVGGELSNNKGLNRQGGGLSARAITEKDYQDILFAVEHKVDYIGLSFPRSAEDIVLAYKLISQAEGKCGIIAKIERREALENLESIIAAADGVMVARGDLGVEIGFAELPAAQELIIKTANGMDKPVITATQMMESMIYNPIPTRAEVTDVANAILQGTDAVMLSAETASGQYPVAVVEQMSAVCIAAEKHNSTKVSTHRLEHKFTRVDEAVAMAAMYTANHLGVTAIISLTESGSTPLWMSRISSGIPIYAVTANNIVKGRMSLFRSVYSVHYDISNLAREEVITKVLSFLVGSEYIASGDLVIVVLGDAGGSGSGSGSAGANVHFMGANTMKIVCVD